jgi:hypothetical protein
VWLFGSKLIQMSKVIESWSWIDELIWRNEPIKLLRESILGPPEVDQEMAFRAACHDHHFPLDKDLIAC